LFTIGLISSQLLLALPPADTTHKIVTGITCPPYVLSSTDPGLCTASGVLLGAPEATGGFIISSMFNNAPPVFPQGFTVVQWTAVSVSNDTAVCEHLVFVKDNEAPALTCPPDQYRVTDPATCSYSVIGNEFDPLSVADNCSGVIISNDINNYYSLSGMVFSKGTTTVNWLATDQFDNTTACSFHIAVTDAEHPLINCLPDPERSIIPGSCSYVVSGTEFDPYYADNCYGYMVFNDYNNSSTLSSAVFPAGFTTVTWSITDENNNNANCTYTVFIADNDAPVIICPDDQVRNTDHNVCNYLSSGPEFDPLVYSDECSNYVITNDLNGAGSLAGHVFTNGGTMVIWTIIDLYGNISSCDLRITVKDNEAPVFSCPGNQVRMADSGTSFYNVLAGELDPLFADNCSWVTGMNSYNLHNTLNGASFALGTTPVSWLFTDGYDNTSSCSYTLTVNSHKSDMEPGFMGEQSVRFSNILGGLSENETQITNDIKVSNYPNPFRDKTFISFSTIKEEEIRLDIFNSSGRLVETLFKGTALSDREYVVEFEGSILPAGIYLYRMTTPDHVFSGKMICSGR
jgi:hypothetical protein